MSEQKRLVIWLTPEMHRYIKQRIQGLSDNRKSLPWEVTLGNMNINMGTVIRSMIASEMWEEDHGNGSSGGTIRE